MLAIIIAIDPVLALDTEGQENTDTRQNAELASGFAVTFGFGITSLDLDDEGESERATAMLLRLDKYDASTNYAVQYSGLSSIFPGTNLIDDFFDCFFSTDDDCDEDTENTTTLSDLSFLYGWRKPDTTYSVGLSYVKSDNTVKKQDDYSTIGLVANLRTKLFWIVDGIAHLNLNKEDSYAALYVSYRFD